MNREQREALKKQCAANKAKPPRGKPQAKGKPPARQARYDRPASEVKYQRLPRGSLKILAWDGQTWHGELRVPCPTEADPLGMQLFTCTAAIERDCFHGLHRCWAEATKPQEAQRE